MTPTYQLVAAVGSSFAAGPNIEPVADASAMRSERNYAHQLAGRLGSRLVDLTVSGATTANLLDTPQEAPGGHVFPPQLDGVTADADVVTITAGGNDLQFIGTMLGLAWLRVDPHSPMVAVLGATAPDDIAPPTARAVEAATTGLVAIVEQARMNAPRARVLLVDYLTVLTAESVTSTPFTADEIEQLMVVQQAIVTVFDEAAVRTGSELLRASTLSTDHALGAQAPWVQPFHREMARTAGSFHPNAAGMTAIAVELERVLTV